VRPRFSLRALLLFTALLAAYLATAQVHRRNLLRQLREFEEQGANFVIEESWVDLLWLRIPKVAKVYIGLEPPESFAQKQDLPDRLKEFGVENVDVTWLW